MNDNRQEIEIPLRESILLTAARLFIDKGYHGVGMRDIAIQSGASKALLYYHFKNKAELFYAILIDNVTRVGELAALAQGKKLDTHARIFEVFSAIASWPVEQRTMIYMAKQEVRHLPDEIRNTFMREYHDQFIGRVQQILQYGIHKGELRTIDSALLVQMLLGMLSPVLTAENLNPAEVASNLETILDVFFNGIHS
jgi:AcrR family transcriptional regulator